ncbi:MAG TPA: PQQ-binding-like beta-propeller repeat protein [Anaeromyxobacteraceae bacterium]|nr:PQQ-binding-like beta-propeller repeat protein [Anaeromyxobacteraceae bacterium]
MIRIRIGQSWAHDASLRAAPDADAEALEEPGWLVDAFAIEVDGVDLAAGRAERNAFGGARDLVGAAARLLAGSAREEVSFPEGEVQLLIRRRDAAALLSVVALSRPARLLARDVEVDLRAFAAAVAAAAEELAHALAAAAPALARRGGAAALLQAARALANAPLRPGEGAAPSAASKVFAEPPYTPGPRCRFELDAGEGLVESYRGPGADLGSLLAPGRVVLELGGSPLTIEAPPFLALRELARLAELVVAAVRSGAGEAEAKVALPGRSRSLPLTVDVARKTLTSTGRPPLAVEPLALAAAIHEAALALCEQLLARNPRQARNPWLADLREASGARLTVARELAQGDLPGAVTGPLAPAARPVSLAAPLGPGRMKRLAFRTSWELDLGAPAGPGLARHGDLVLAAGEGGAAAVEAGTGRLVWRAPGAVWASLSGGLWLSTDGSALTARGVEDGEVRWEVPLPVEGARVAGTASPAGGPLLVLAGGVIAALDWASGVIRWRFERAAAPVTALASFGGLAVAAGSTGTLYALEAGGRLAWRVHAPAPLVGGPEGWQGALLALCRGDRDGYLLALDPASGRRRFESPLQFAPAGAPLPLGQRLAVAGTVAGDPVVAALDPGGAVVWTTAPGLRDGDPPALAPLEGGLLAKAADGALAALSGDGAPRWSAGSAGRHPPPGNLPPHVARGLVVSPAEEVAIYRAAGGEKVGTAPLSAPVRLLVEDDLSMLAMDAAGVVTAVRLATHLSVV